jgi:biotin carboxyl carrier protein
MVSQINLEELLVSTETNQINKINDSIFEINNEVIEVLNVNFDTKELNFRHNHSTHIVQFKNNLDYVLDKMGIKRTFEAVNTDVKAPMPGKVLSVMINVGDTVAKGDGIMILEAMKMENVLKAEGDCVIKSILIEAGQTVEKGQVMIELEDAEA